MMRILRRLLLLLALVALAPGLDAQPAPERNLGPQELLERWQTEANEIEVQLENEEAPETEYSQLRAELEEQAQRIPALLQEAEAAAKPIREQLDALGPAPEEGGTEAESVAAERERLQGELKQAEALIAQLNQAKARAETLIAQTVEKRRALFTERLLTPGPVPVRPRVIAEGLAALTRTAVDIVKEVQYRLKTEAVDTGSVARSGAVLVLLVIVLIGLRTFRGFVMERLRRLVGPDATQARCVAVGVGLTLVRVITPSLSVFVFLVGVSVSGVLGPEGTTLLVALGLAATFFIAAWALSLAYFAPGSPRLRLSSLDDQAAGRAHWWVVALAGVVSLDRALVANGDDIGIAIEGLILLNAVLITLGGVALWQVIRQIAHRTDDIPRGLPSGEDEEDAAADAQSREIGMVGALSWLARLLGRVIAVLAPVLALAGYFAASRYAFYPFVFSGGVICLALLLYQIVQAGVERFISISDMAPADEASKGRLRLIPVLVGFLLTCLALPALAMIWGASTNDLGLVWRRLVEGVELGEFRLSPRIILSFLTVFAIGFLITRLIQSILTRSVLPLTNLDTGGRDAIRAGVGYVGVMLAAIAAISSAGIDLSNLAIALGALSVGIGFGLQNVVNNFVSGIILLIERPIKTGDWVQLASGTGYVKQINVRSTEIETFDRSSLIVPNSELISMPVVNWTHSNNNGRIIVPVGVAYGTDPRKVEKILMEVAKGHPMLMRRPAPYVLFNNFGPDALEFEVRGVLRDVNWVLNVGSDLRYEIARRFEEEGIQIPFAQRDLHLKNADEIAAAFSRGQGGERSDGDGRRNLGSGSDDSIAAAGEGDDGSGLLRLADPSGRRRGGGRPLPPAEEPPWQALSDASDALPDEEDAPARSRFGRAAGSDIDGGDGR